MKYGNSELFGSKITSIEIAPNDIKLIHLLMNPKISWTSVLVDISVTNSKGESKMYHAWDFNEVENITNDYWKEHFLLDNQEDRDLILQ